MMVKTMTNCRIVVKTIMVIPNGLPKLGLTSVYRKAESKISKTKSYGSLVIHAFDLVAYERFKLKRRTTPMGRISRHIGGPIIEMNRVEYVDRVILDIPVLYAGRVLEGANGDATKCREKKRYSIVKYENVFSVFHPAISIQRVVFFHLTDS